MDILDADLMMTKRSQPRGKYEYDLMLVFWLAVHLENLEIVQALVDREPIIKKLVTAHNLKNSTTKKTSMSYNDSKVANGA